MKKLLIVLILIASCSSNDAEFRKRANTIPECDPALISQRSKFVLDCIDKAKPTEDLQPNRWITVCNTISKDVFCLGGD